MHFAPRWRASGGFAASPQPGSKQARSLRNAWSLPGCLPGTMVRICKITWRVSFGGCLLFRSSQRKTKLETTILGCPLEKDTHTHTQTPSNPGASYQRPRPAVCNNDDACVALCDTSRIAFLDLVPRSRPAPDWPP